MPVVIGLTGKKRVGKDTVAARLVNYHGFRRVAFADKLRAVVLAADPLVHIEQDEVGPAREAGLSALVGYGWANANHLRLSLLVEACGWEAAKEVREVRRLLQTTGVGVRDHLGSEAWVDAVESTVALSDRPVVITDVRFPNEAAFVQWRADGYLARVVRDTGDAAAGAHSSETAMDAHPVDVTIDNNGTIDDLCEAADALARRALDREADHLY